MNPENIENRKAALALNLCTVSVSQIIDYEDINILKQEYDAILNNINLQEIIKVLMQQVDSLCITHVHIYFSSRHGREQENITAAIARTPYFRKWPGFSKEGELISPSVFARPPL